MNKGILAMLDSPDCTIEQARQHIMDEYDHWIRYFARTEASIPDVIYAAALRHNHDALAPVFGDKTATLTD